MSQNDRIERHLMRQRGAGVRAVTADFGFTLALPPLTSSASVLPDEPAAKRRKTIAREADIAALNHEKAENKPGAITEKPATNAAKKPRTRRKIPVDDAEVPPTTTSPGGGDDSFMHGVEPRQTVRWPKERVTVDALQVAGHNAAKASPKRRPRRQAAASATVKVMAGFAEEAVPIDKKRRAAEATDTADMRSKKQKAVVKARKGTLTVEIVTQTLLLEQLESAELAPRSRTRKRAKAVETCNEVASAGEFEATNQPTADAAEAESDPPKAPQKRARTTAKARRPKATKAYKVAEAVEIDATTQPCAETLIPGSGAPKQPRKRARKIMRAKQTPQNVSQVEGVRQPLADADANVTMRSVSPEKAGRSNSPEKLNEAGTRHNKRREDEIESIRAKAKPKSRRKLKVQPDDAMVLPELNAEVDAGGDDVNGLDEVQGIVSMVELPTPPRSSGVTLGRHEHNAATEAKAVISQASACPEGDVQASARPLPSHAPLKKGKAEGRPPEATPDQVAAKPQSTKAETLRVEAEEDVDWLFEPAESKRPERRKAPPAAKGKARRASHTLKASADIDLEDLLSNIAAFAGAQQTASLETAGKGANVARKGKRR